MKTINVSDDLWARLVDIKTKGRYRKISDVVDGLVSKFEVDMLEIRLDGDTYKKDNMSNIQNPISKIQKGDE